VSAWTLFFAWPTGGVWSNLIASAITTVLGLSLVAWRFFKKLDQKHAEHRALMKHQTQQQLDEHHDRIHRLIRAQYPQGGLRVTGGGDRGPESHAGS
jgi:hypothetical protein